MIRSRPNQSNGVVYFDLTGYYLEGYNKFIPYYLFPDSTYTVSVSPSGFRTKVSVGSNPWAPATPNHNLPPICERYRGGGHPTTRAGSSGAAGREPARKIAEENLEEMGDS